MLLVLIKSSFSISSISSVSLFKFILNSYFSFRICNVSFAPLIPKYAGCAKVCANNDTADSLFLCATPNNTPVTPNIGPTTLKILSLACGNVFIKALFVPVM